MKKKALKNLVSELCLEQYGYDLTKKERKLCWAAYRSYIHDIRNDPNKIIEAAIITTYGPKEMSAFRNALAVKGIEITPREACLYAMTIECVLLESGFYVWDEDDI